jgi:hypothetical protein
VVPVLRERVVDQKAYNISNRQKWLEETHTCSTMFDSLPSVHIL